MNSECDDPEATTSVTQLSVFVHSLGLMMQASRDFVESDGKFRLWALLVYATTPVSRLCFMLKQCQFLSYSVHLFHCKHGIIGYTLRDHQLNANVAVPAYMDADVDLIDTFVDFWKSSHKYSLNMLPLTSHLRYMSAKSHKVMLFCRRVIPPATNPDEILYDDESETLTFDDQTIPAERLENARDILGARPIRKMSDDDDTDTLYWLKTKTGEIVKFKNPRKKTLSGLNIDNRHMAALDLASTLKDDTVRTVIKSLRNHSNDYDISHRGCIEFVNDGSLPLDLRRFVFCFHCRQHGVSDDIIDLAPRLICESHVEALNTFFSLLQEVHGIKQKLDMGDNVHEMHIVAMLCQVQFHSESETMWDVWMRRSRFIAAMIMTMTSQALIRICIDLRSFCERVDCVLASCVEAWHHDDTIKAKFLIDQGTACVTVRQEFLRRQELTMDACLRLSNDARNADNPLMTSSRRDAPKQVPSSSRRHKSKKWRRESRVLSAAVSSTVEKVESADIIARPQGTVESPLALTTSSMCCNNYTELCRRFEDTYDVRCTLIGSGRFFRARDMDIVVHVDDDGVNDTSLQDAYDHVRAQLGDGWATTHIVVTGEYVVTLHGMFEGVRVDVQVLRTRSLHATVAESMTRRTIDFTNSLLRGCSTEAMRDVVLLHKWADGVDLKGHKLCRLPGIAITCMAVVFSCEQSSCDADESDGVRLSRMLMRMYCLLGAECPMVRFDSQNSIMETSRDDGCPCVSPLCVMVNGFNTTHRMTTGTTRHLRHCVSHTIGGAATPPMTCVFNRFESLVREWRRDHMFIAASLPYDEGTAATFLKTAMIRLDGHPCIDSVHVDVMGGHLRVWVTLSGEGTADVYGFRDEDVVCADSAHVDDDAAHRITTATVTRGTKSWRLTLTPLHDRALEEHGRLVPSVQSWKTRARVSDRIDLVDSTMKRSLVILPNMPSLTRDVESAMRAWEWV